MKTITILITTLITTLAFAQQKMDIKMCCLESRIGDDNLIYEVWPDDGGKPYGIHIGIAMNFVDLYNQSSDPDISIEYVKGTVEECLSKMRSGEVDMMMNLKRTQKRQEFMSFYDIDRNGEYSLVTSRKGRLANFSFAVNEAAYSVRPKLGSIENTDWENMGKSLDEIEIAYNCEKVKEEDILDLTKLADDSPIEQKCEKRKLSEIVAYIDKEFIFSLYMNQMSEIVKSSDWLIYGEGPDGGDIANYYHTYGPIFFNINSPINSVMLTGEQHRFLDNLSYINSSMEPYSGHSQALKENIDHCLEDPSACIYFDEAVVTYLVMKNSYGIDFAENFSACSGDRPIVVYSKDKSTSYSETKPYQRISFQGSCFDNQPPHYFIGRQDKNSATAPFLKGTYSTLINSLANYHYSTIWEKEYPDPKEYLGNVKVAINESKNILKNEKEWQNATSFINDYGKLMQNSIQSRKQRIDELVSQEKQKEEKHIADLKNRVRPPKDIDEALIYFDVGYGEFIVTSTPYKADGKVYGIIGTVEGMIDKYYKINSIGLFGERIFLLDTHQDLNESQIIQIVGKFNDVMMLTTLFSDVAKPYAVFSDLQFLNGKLLQ